MPLSPLALLLILSYFSLALGAYVQLHTGRGAIEASKINSVSGTLTENTLCYACEEQFWELVKDTRFPNGVFIRSKAFPNLVWDTQGSQAATGVSVILNSQHDTLDTTKTQRWANTTHSQLAVEKNVNYVVQVNSAIGTVPTLTLSPKTPQNTFQNFIAISKDDFANVTVINTEDRPIIVGFETSGGSWSGYQNYLDTQTYVALLGSTITIEDDNEVLVYSAVITSRDTQITMPIPSNNLPVGEHHYSGQFQDGTNVTFVITFSGDASQNLSGSGTDSERGDFTLGGSYELGGRMDFGMDYGGDWQNNRQCFGQLDSDGITIKGLCDGMSPYQIVMDS